MDTMNNLTCDVTSDIMVLYTTGKTSPETNQLVEAHLQTCEACSQAFGREPALRGHVPRRTRPAPAFDLDHLGAWIKYLGVTVLGFLLFLLSRLLQLLDRLLRRFGKSTTTLKIRVFRARRAVAGKLTPQPETATA